MGFLFYFKNVPGTFSNCIKTLNTFHFSLKICKFMFDTIQFVGLVSGAGDGRWLRPMDTKDGIKERVGCFMPISYQTHQN